MLAEVIHKVAQLLHDDTQAYHPRPSMCSPEFPDSPGRCIRQMVYHRLGAPARPLPGRALLVFDDGRWHEELSAQWIQKTAYTLHSRQQGVDIPLPAAIGTGYDCAVCNPPRAIPPDILHGHIDGLLTDCLNTTRLWEHKAINHFAFQGMLDGELPLDYIAQGCAYLAGLQGPRPDIQEALLLLKNKNTSAYLEFRFHYDPVADRCTLVERIASNGTAEPPHETIDGILTSAFAKFQIVEEYAALGALPPRPYRQDSWRCSYCSWGDSCWENYAAEVAARDPEAPIPELAATLEQYYEAKRAKAQGDKTMKRLRPLILNALEARNTKRGVADGLIAAVRTQQRTELDHELLPPAAKKAAMQTRTIEVLDVARIRSAAGSGTDPITDHAPAEEEHAAQLA
jgi:hypothetical protein